MEQCAPDVVVISSKYQDKLMDQIERFGEHHTGPGESAVCLYDLTTYS